MSVRQERRNGFHTENLVPLKLIARVSEYAMLPEKSMLIIQRY